METLDEIVKKWDSFGFLKGLDEEKKVLLASRMDEMAQYLTCCGEQKHVENCSTLVFPILRKAISEGGLILSYTPKKMCDFIDMTIEPMTEAIKTLADDGNIDEVAEYCFIVSKIFTQQKS